MRLIKLTEVKRIPECFYIEAHNVYKERYFNAYKIENFIRLDDATYLYMSTSSSAFEVVETPEQIIQLIKQAEEI